MTVHRKRGKRTWNRGITKLDQIYEWDDEFETGHVWAKTLNIKPSTFVRRVNQYGIDDKRTFYTNEQMRKHTQAIRTAAGRAGGEKAKRTYHKKNAQTKLCKPLDPTELAKDPQFKQRASDLIAHLISDAKKNLKSMRKGARSPYYDECKRWLMNGNGGLQFLLEYTDMDLRASLKELKIYAETNIVGRNLDSTRRQK